MRETFPYNLVKIRHDDVILCHVTSFPYIFPYYDVIMKNADISKNNEVKVINIMGILLGDDSLYPCKRAPLRGAFWGYLGSGADLPPL